MARWSAPCPAQRVSDASSIDKHNSIGNELTAVESIWLCFCAIRAGQPYITLRVKYLFCMYLDVPYITPVSKVLLLWFVSSFTLLFVLIRVISLFLYFLYNIVPLRGAWDHGKQNNFRTRKESGHAGVWTDGAFSCYSSRYITYANSM